MADGSRSCIGRDDELDVPGEWPRTLDPVGLVEHLAGEIAPGIPEAGIREGKVDAEVMVRCTSTPVSSARCSVNC